MVRVRGSSGQAVSVEITGVGEVVRRLRAMGFDIENRVDLAVVKAGALIEDEVKESITGARDEPRSVDSGTLANSIQANKKGSAHMEIAPKRIRYPGSKVTTVDVATFLEFGTTNITPRRHFKNTEARNKKKVAEMVEKAVRRAVKK